MIIRRLLLVSLFLPFSLLFAQQLPFSCGTPECIERFFARPVGERRDEPVPSAPTREQIETGQIDVFYTHIPEQKVKATCIGIGEHLYLYVENSVLPMVNEIDTAEIIRVFDTKIYPNVQRHFGSEWRPGLDRDLRITILMHDVGRDRSARDYAGYFSPADQHLDASYSNQREMIYMDTYSFRDRSRWTFFSSLAHEFVHLVNWYQNGGRTDQRWLEEGMASFSEWIIYQKIHSIYVEGYLKNPTVSLHSLDHPDLYYGASFLLLLYLYENHGGQDFIRQLIAEDLLGLAGIEAVLRKIGDTIPISELVINWAVANLLNEIDRISDLPLGYNGLPTKFFVQSNFPTFSGLPISRTSEVQPFGIFYAKIVPAVTQLTVTLTGNPNQRLEAKVLRLPTDRRERAICVPIPFDAANRGRLYLTDLDTVTELYLVLTGEQTQQFQLEIEETLQADPTREPIRAERQQLSMPKTIFRPVGDSFQNSPKRPNTDYRFEPLERIHLSSRYQDLVITTGPDSLPDHAYVASGWGLEVFDLTDPLQPKLMMEIKTDGNAQDIVVKDSIAYIADGAAGLQMIQIAPTLKRLNTIAVGENLHQVLISEEFPLYLFAIDAELGLFLFNTSNLVNEAEPVATFRTLGLAMHVTVANRRVYLADSRRGVQILSLDRLPLLPVIGALPYVGYDMVIEDQIAYVAGGNVYAVTLHDPLNPKIVSEVKTPGQVISLTPIENRENRLQSILSVDYRSGIYKLGVERFDNRAPEVELSLEAHQSTHTRPLAAFAVPMNTDLVYVADGEGYLDLIRFDGPPVWEYRHSRSGNLTGFDMDGDQIFAVSQGAGLFSISNGRFISQSEPGFSGEDLIVEDGFGYIVTGQKTRQQNQLGLLIVDLSNPKKVQRVGQVPTDFPAYDVRLNGQTAYVCATELLVINVRQPRAAVPVSRYPMSGAAFQSVVYQPPDAKERFLFVAALNGGVHLYDCTEAQNLRHLTVIETAESVIGVSVVDGWLALLENRSHLRGNPDYGSLRLFDITNPRTPRQVKTFETPAYPIQIELEPQKHSIEQLPYLYLLNPDYLHLLDTETGETVTRSQPLQQAKKLIIVQNTALVVDQHGIDTFRLNRQIFALAVDQATQSQPMPDGGMTGGIDHPNLLSLLGQSFPNPANPETWIPFRLAQPGVVTVTLFDQKGQPIRQILAGHHLADEYTSKAKAIYWDGKTQSGETVTSGIYFYHLLVDDGQRQVFTQTKMLTIVR
jgi:hypothetical protein